MAQRRVGHGRSPRKLTSPISRRPGPRRKMIPNTSDRSTLRTTRGASSQLRSLRASNASRIGGARGGSTTSRGRSTPLTTSRQLRATRGRVVGPAARAQVTASRGKTIRGRQTPQRVGYRLSAAKGTIGSRVARGQLTVRPRSQRIQSRFRGAQKVREGAGTLRRTRGRLVGQGQSRTLPGKGQRLRNAAHKLASGRNPGGNRGVGRGRTYRRDRLGRFA